jgi:hypothetical protein
MSESSEALALKAARERQGLQASIDELKSRVTETLDIEQHVSHHVLGIAGLAALAAATIGYGVAGIFSRR